MQNFSTSDETWILQEIKRFKHSKKHRNMICGQRYYVGKHDILNRQRTVIGSDGKLENVENLPNNHIVNNQYKKLVDQKSNYLVGKPFSIQCDNMDFSYILNRIFDRRFRRTLKNITHDSLNCGVGWLYVGYDANGNLDFKRMKPHEIIPVWSDSSHLDLEYAIRLYEMEYFNGKNFDVIEKVEVFDSNGIRFFDLINKKLIPCEPYHQNHFNFTIDDKTYPCNWSKTPLICFKYNDLEQPLISMVKSLQDAINVIMSNFQNQMEEDVHNTILVLINYDGENLGEFRKNLSTYGAVKVRTVDGAGGDLKKLQVEVNAENYNTILSLLKDAIIENGMGCDAKDDRLGGSPNQMNIQSMYTDLDLDANAMETEFQASFENLLWFVLAHLKNLGYGDFTEFPVSLIFNRDMLLNETEYIENCIKSMDILSQNTVISNHPWVVDPLAEINRINNTTTQGGQNE